MLGEIAKKGFLQRVDDVIQYVQRDFVYCESRVLCLKLRRSDRYKGEVVSCYGVSFRNYYMFYDGHNLLRLTKGLSFL